MSTRNKTKSPSQRTFCKSLDDRQTIFGEKDKGNMGLRDFTHWENEECSGYNEVDWLINWSINW